MSSDNRASTTPERVGITEREANALELRKAGVTFARIAQQLGFADSGGAHKAVKRALQATIQVPADELRQVECERLDALLLIAWRKAQGGSMWAIDRCLSIMDRRAKLLGLDAPMRTRVEVITTDALMAAMVEMEAELARNNEIIEAGSRSIT